MTRLFDGLYCAGEIECTPVKKKSTMTFIPSSDQAVFNKCTLVLVLDDDIYDFLRPHVDPYGFLDGVTVGENSRPAILTWVIQADQTSHRPLFNREDGFKCLHQRTVGRISGGLDEESGLVLVPHHFPRGIQRDARADPIGRVSSQ